MTRPNIVTGTACTNNAPPIAPRNTSTIASLFVFQSIWPNRWKLVIAIPVPNTDCNLLVASAFTGGKPAVSSAGIMIKPPPPAIASMKPVNTAVAVNAP